ncbi:coiled-coil domain-containing protein 153 isoform X3 [Sphaerodactylus townsendi]|uniref:coiled-coil domain-containing protein 153 isoform X3 n=1 Tax=Sphaerodactylus townsendi TaxID=933632 RepID=UPI002025FF15|nr:coiled-coil domain-containing protein 153 isoform X3 [Sphaerodactylus townsendi]
MSPMRKGKGKKGGKQKKTTVADEEKYRKSLLEVETLKQHLVLRRDVARQAMADSEGLKQRLAELEQELKEARGDKQDIYEAACREDVQQSRADKAKMQEEKEEAISKMQRKIDSMETEYEKILHGSLDLVLSKLEAAKLGWEKEATSLHLEYKDRLKEFGLNPLEI